MLQFTRDLIELRLAHRVFRRRRYLTGKDAADLLWFTPSGTVMTAEDWADPLARSVALFIDNLTDPDLLPDGTPAVDDDFLVLVNSWWETLEFQIPPDVSARRWELVCDSFDPARGGAAAGAINVGLRRWWSCDHRPERVFVGTASCRQRCFTPHRNRWKPSAPLDHLNDRILECP